MRRSLIPVLGFAFAIQLVMLSLPCNAAGSSPYCGIYSLYGAARALDCDVAFASLIDTRYVSSQQGSTLEDLQSAAEMAGLGCTAIRGPGRSLLTSAEHPLLLHVTPAGNGLRFNHWILFLGIEGGQAVIHDGPGGELKVPVEFVLSRWDGIALAVHDENRSTFYTLTALLRLALMVGLIGVFLRLRFFFHFSDNEKTHLVHQCFKLGVISFLLGITMWGLRTHPPSFGIARRSLEVVHGIHQFNDVSLVDLCEYVNLESAIFVDARDSVSFSRGTIPSAVNVPANSSLGELNNQLGSADRGRKIIVFCQSPKCRFSDVVTQMLCSIGFEDVEVCRDGYQGWAEHGEI